MGLRGKAGRLMVILYFTLISLSLLAFLLSLCDSSLFVPFSSVCCMGRKVHLYVHIYSPQYYWGKHKAYSGCFAKSRRQWGRRRWERGDESGSTTFQNMNSFCCQNPFGVFKYSCWHCEISGWMSQYRCLAINLTAILRCLCIICVVVNQP